jgi:hypothetical protein
MTDAETIETMRMLAERIKSGCTLTLTPGKAWATASTMPVEIGFEAMLCSESGVVLARASSLDLTNAVRFALEAARSSKEIGR